MSVPVPAAETPALSEILGGIASPEAGATSSTLRADVIRTPLGAMVAMADERALHMLEFHDRRALEPEIERLQATLDVGIEPGRTPVIEQIEAELAEYFAGRLHVFSTPFVLGGTPFQQSVWRALLEIPYGQVCSYAELAESLGKPSAFRAVAKANSCNQLAVIVPCHRVIYKGGKLSGYAGGIERKQWLLHHELNNR